MKLSKKTQLSIAIAVLISSIAIFFIVRGQGIKEKLQTKEPVNKQTVSDYNPNIQATVLEVKDVDVVQGQPTAPITVIEYASFSCSHCKHFATKIFPKIKKDYIDSGKVKFILRDFPLDEPSLRASQLTKCVPDESYHDFVKVLFESQANWATKKDFPEKLENIAKISGMSGKDFHKCMENKDLEEKILQNRLDAYNGFKINSTPSFIINGQKYSGSYNYEGLSKYFDELLKK